MTPTILVYSSVRLHSKTREFFGVHFDRRSYSFRYARTFVWTGCSRNLLIFTNVFFFKKTFFLLPPLMLLLSTVFFSLVLSLPLLFLKWALARYPSSVYKMCIYSRISVIIRLLSIFEIANSRAHTHACTRNHMFLFIYSIQNVRQYYTISTAVKSILLSQKNVHRNG